MLRQVARFYVEVMRGVPIIVLLLYVAFVLAPGARRRAGTGGSAWLGLSRCATRDFPLLWRAIIALSWPIPPSLAEVFRAGLLSVDAGQIEAAEALGLTRLAAVSPRGLSAGVPDHPAAARATISWRW